MVCLLTCWFVRSFVQFFLSMYVPMLNVCLMFHVTFAHNIQPTGRVYRRWLFLYTTIFILRVKKSYFSAFGGFSLLLRCDHALSLSLCIFSNYLHRQTYITPSIIQYSRHEAKNKTTTPPNSNNDCITAKGEKQIQKRTGNPSKNRLDLFRMRLQSYCSKFLLLLRCCCCCLRFHSFFSSSEVPLSLFFSTHLLSPSTSLTVFWNNLQLCRKFILLIRFFGIPYVHAMWKMLRRNKVVS